jgi:hypothetical protein
MKNFDHNIVFEKNANIFAENCRKSQKIVITTSTPDLTQLSPNPCAVKRGQTSWTFWGSFFDILTFGNLNADAATSHRH